MAVTKKLPFHTNHIGKHGPEYNVLLDEVSDGYFPRFALKFLEMLLFFRKTELFLLPNLKAVKESKLFHNILQTQPFFINNFHKY